LPSPSSMRKRGCQRGLNVPTNPHGETTMTDDITRHAVNNYFKNHIEENEEITDKNTELIRDFMEAQRGTKDRTKKREKEYLYAWKQLGARFVDDDMEEMTLKDWCRAVAEMKEVYADNTLNDYKGAIRQFYKQRYKEDKNYPEKVEVILDSKDLEDDTDPEKVEVENLFTMEQVLKLSEVAENPRDACLPLYLLDAGPRTFEAICVDLGNVHPHEDYYKVSHHDCKNGRKDRDLPLTYCMEKLRMWLEVHPYNRKENPEKPLWCITQKQGEGEYGSRMSNKNFNDTVKRLGRRAKQKYPKLFQGYDPETYNVYDFRRSSATLKASEEGLGVNDMLWHYAWLDPERAKSYLRGDNDRMRKSVMSKKGLEPEDNKGNKLRPVDCERCGHKPSIDASYCPSCSKPLSTSSAMDKEKLLEAGRIVMNAKLDEKISDKEVRELVQKVSTI
jgi:site-specific recombinase XerD